MKMYICMYVCAGIFYTTLCFKNNPNEFVYYIGSARVLVTLVRTRVYEMRTYVCMYEYMIAR